MTTDLNRVTESESQARENTRAELVMYNEFNSISCSDDSPESRNRPTIGGQCLRLYDTTAYWLMLLHCIQSIELPLNVALRRAAQLDELLDQRRLKLGHLPAVGLRQLLRRALAPLPVRLLDL